MKRSVKSHAKGQAPKPMKKAPQKPIENPCPWWQDDNYNTAIVVEDPDRYKSNYINDPPLRRNFL